MKPRSEEQAGAAGEGGTTGGEGGHPGNGGHAGDGGHAGADGGAGGSRDGDELANACPEQRRERTDDGFDVVRCLALYDEAPLLRVPKEARSRYATLDSNGFDSLDGVHYDALIQEELPKWDAEQERHGSAVYRIATDGGEVISFEPALVFEEVIFLEPLLGKVLEGTISRRINETSYDDESTLPVRGTVTLDASKQSLVFNIDNWKEALSASDGACLPALTDAGAENPFATGETATLVGSRVTSMHYFGDSMLVLHAQNPEQLNGSVMGASWYLSPRRIVLDELTVEPYGGAGHGRPGRVWNLGLKQVTGGGDACVP